MGRAPNGIQIVDSGQRFDHPCPVPSFCKVTVYHGLAESVRFVEHFCQRGGIGVFHAASLLKVGLPSPCTEHIARMRFLLPNRTAKEFVCACSIDMPW